MKGRYINFLEEERDIIGSSCTQCEAPLTGNLVEQHSGMCNRCLQEELYEEQEDAVKVCWSHDAINCTLCGVTM